MPKHVAAYYFSILCAFLGGYIDGIEFSGSINLLKPTVLVNNQLDAQFFFRIYYHHHHVYEGLGVFPVL